MRFIDDLPKLNSLTKYPSIPTYHALGEKGVLTEDHLDAPDGDLLYTEKVDGTNARIILIPGEAVIIGSREELLHSVGDLIHNPSQGIVDQLRETADLIRRSWFGGNEIIVVYGEVYGGRIGRAAKQYAKSGSVDFRMFDVVRIPINDARALIGQSRDQISLWRENGGQPFVEEEKFREHAAWLNIDITPRIELPSGHARLPESNLTGVDWLKGLVPETQVALDEGSGLESEGIVVRARDRSFIAKLRYEDYQRTLKRR